MYLVYLTDTESCFVSFQTFKELASCVVRCLLDYSHLAKIPKVSQDRPAQSPDHLGVQLHWNSRVMRIVAVILFFG